MKVFIETADYINPFPAVKKAMDQFPVNFTDKVVLLKPNLLGPYPPEKGVTTHPSIVRAVMEYVESKNPKKIYIGDSPGVEGYGQTMETARISGIASIAGKRFINFADEVKRVPIKSRYMKEISVPKILDEVDMVVNLPKFKTHMLTYITGALKNMFGIVVGADKARIHSLCRTVHSFSEAILDIFSYKVPVLNVMDAVVGMEGGGPNSGKLLPLGKILVSDNAVAMDSVMAYMMNMKVKKIPLLSIAAEKRMGETNLKKIEVNTPVEPVGKFKRPLSYHVQRNPLFNLGIFLSGIFMGKVSKSNLVLEKEACIRCGVCMKQCPAGAISMSPYPVIDTDKCITCYCCCELCTYNAWKMK
ncbi:MAG: DUF362 domain-containing protein [Spirochaetales bacterium]|nr:DUF362 domain-containing protein [Spirochaetales bacterium]